MKANIKSLLWVSLLLLQCCKDSGHNDDLKVNSQLKAGLMAESLIIPPSLPDSPSVTNFPREDEFSEILANPKIDNCFKKIFRAEKLIPADDKRLLSIPDSLFSKNNKAALFYFIVFTKSMNGSDGFYSEAIGNSSYAFVATKTLKFAENFHASRNLTIQDMNNWAKFVYDEIQVNHEGNEDQAVADLEKTLIRNSIQAKKEHQEIIERFIDLIRRERAIKL